MVARVVLVSLVTLALTGCQQESASPESRLDCDDPTEVELGLPTVDVPARFTTTNGRLRIAVTGMSPDALIPIDTTMVFLGAAETVPHRDPERPEWPDNGSYQERVSLDQPGYLDVEAGSYWLVSPAGGRIFVAACPDITLTDVVPVSP